MNTAPTTIDRKQLKLLASHGGVKSVLIEGSADRFSLRVFTIGGEAVLHEQRGKVRAWKKVDTVLSYLKDELGIARAAIDFTSWNPEQRTIDA